MDTVPTMISTKDSSYLSDIFEWNFTALKKAYHFSDEVSDEEIKQKLNELYIIHKEICEQIITILN